MRVICTLLTAAATWFRSSQCAGAALLLFLFVAAAPLLLPHCCCVADAVTAMLCSSDICMPHAAWRSLRYRLLGWPLDLEEEALGPAGPREERWRGGPATRSRVPWAA